MPVILGLGFASILIAGEVLRVTPTLPESSSEPSHEATSSSDTVAQDADQPSLFSITRRERPLAVTESTPAPQPARPQASEEAAPAAEPDPPTSQEPEITVVCTDIAVGEHVWRGCNSSEGSGVWRAGTDWATFTDDGRRVGAYYTIENARRACPDGYRLPTVLEWTSLVANLREEAGHSFTVAHFEQKLKLPRVGSLYHLGGPNYAWRDREVGKYWTSSTEGDGDAFVYTHIMSMSVGSGVVRKGDAGTTLLSVRCIKE